MQLQLETIINALEDGILCLDESLRVVFLNEAAAKMIGCDAGSALSQSMAPMPGLAALLGQLMLDELSQPGAPPKVVRKLRGHPSDEDTFPLEAVITRAVEHGRGFYIVDIRDVTLRRQMEKAVYQARKTEAIGALAGGIAHDFNNLLTAVISQIDLALYSKELPATLKDHLNYAKTGARRGAELVSKLQLFSRHAQSQLTTVALPDVVEQVVFMLKRSVPPSVGVRFPGGNSALWQVKADSGQIMQALVNLGLNARDAMPDGGELRIEMANAILSQSENQPSRKAGEFVRVTVSDTGHGMSPETVGRLFDPYFTTKDSSKGQGLGLSITAGVVAEHGGWLEVESRLGHGTKFHLFLPRAGEEAHESRPRECLMSDPKALQGNERILIVDDEELVRMVMRAVLAYRGYHVVEAGDGEEAVRTCLSERQPFDLVLMDLHMPRLNGRDALIRIREKEPRLKAVLLSGGLQDRESETTVALQGVRFLQKPFDNQELLRLVRDVLDAVPQPC